MRVIGKRREKEIRKIYRLLEKRGGYVFRLTTANQTPSKKEAGLPQVVLESSREGERKETTENSLVGV